MTVNAEKFARNRARPNVSAFVFCQCRNVLSCKAVLETACFQGAVGDAVVFHAYPQASVLVFEHASGAGSHAGYDCFGLSVLQVISFYLALAPDNEAACSVRYA